MVDRFIVLTDAEARQVRGATKPGHELDPVPLEDGVSFILPERVLSDPAHAVKFAALDTLSKALDDKGQPKLRAVADAEFKAEAAEAALAKSDTVSVKA